MPGTAPLMVTVPLHDADLAAPEPDRVRKLRRHLIEALRDLRVAKRPDRLVQPPTPEPHGFAATVLREGCTQCQGHCCRNGGEHAYIDERTMARVRRDHPDLDARAIIRMYIEAVAPAGYRGSCLFHGREGCTLPKPLRAELCNSYYCSGLSNFLQWGEFETPVVVAAQRGDKVRRSRVLRPGQSHGQGKV
jgi:hypothetical protein